MSFRETKPAAFRNRDGGAMTGMRAGLHAWPVAALMAVLVSTAAAHDVPLAEAEVTVERGGAALVATRGNLPAFLLGEMPDRVTDEMIEGLLALSDGALGEELQAAATRFREGLTLDVRNGGFELHDLAWPDPAAFRQQWGEFARQGAGGRELLTGVTLRGVLTGDGPEAMRLGFPPRWGDVATTFQAVGAEPLYALLSPGEKSPWISLSSGRWLEQPGVGWLPVAHRYLVLGIEHIIPKGLDHILFVLGLFLLAVRWRPLLAQVTAFTVAHSVTLALSLYGMVSLPPQVVEPLIAASIAYVAIENVLTDRLHRWRPFVIFGFGLLHGLGFAGVLMGLGLPREHFLPALVFFNVGVEVGQLAVLVCAFAAVGLYCRKSWYRAWVAVPLSACIALVALFWTFERLVGVS